MPSQDAYFKINLSLFVEGIFAFLAIILLVFAISAIYYGSSVLYAVIFAFLDILALLGTWFFSIRTTKICRQVINGFIEEARK